MAYMEQVDLKSQLHPPSMTMDDTPLQNTIDQPLLCPNTAACVAASCCCPVTMCGFCKTVKVKEEITLLSFGKYQATLRVPGLYLINPCCMQSISVSTAKVSVDLANVKVADGNGNPLLLSGVVTYVVSDSRKAALDVESYKNYIRTQGTAVMKQVASMYPYEARGNEPSLKTEATALRQSLIQNLQDRVNVAGISVLNFEFNDLAYAPEIAQVMLVRQQAVALLDARTVVAEGAVSIAANTIAGLEAQKIKLSDQDKVRMATNLVVSICSDGGVTRTMSVGADN
jgi:regulator of protease activity HflC (stomatin/prohibitin superfamily)